jgi:alkyl hydroperoxide reductase subunit AhpC
MITAQPPYGAKYMAGVGRRFPRFALTGVVSSDPQKAFRPATHESFSGKWKIYVTDENIGEVLRVLDALQTDELCPCNSHKGDETLKAA